MLGFGFALIAFWVPVGIRKEAGNEDGDREREGTPHPCPPSIVIPTLVNGIRCTTY